MLAFPGITTQILEALSQELESDHPFEKLRCGLQKAYQQAQQEAEKAQQKGGQCSSKFQPKEKETEIEYAQPIIKGNEYSLSLDFRKFKPEEVEIKLGADKMLQISGKHEKMSDDGSSYVYRQYIHHFSVPDNVEHELLKSQLDQRGILRISAPVKRAEPAEDGSRAIPIEVLKSA